jgi:hypothetical protein
METVTINLWGGVFQNVEGEEKLSKAGVRVVLVELHDDEHGEFVIYDSSPESITDEIDETIHNWAKGKSVEELRDWLKRFKED